MYRFPGFKRSTIENYLGKRPIGTVEFLITSGPYNSEATRRLKMKLNVLLRLDDKHGVVDSIVFDK